MFQYQQQYDQLPPTAALFHPPQLMPPAIYYRRQCRRTGKVKFFNMSKGYGFIIPNQSQYPQEQQQQQHELTPYKKPSSSSAINESKPNRVQEVFVHHTSILSLNKGYLATLNKGEEVEYELHDGPKGIYALYVTGLHGRYLDCNKYAIDYPANAPANAIAATTTSSSSSTTTTTQQHEAAEYHHHISELANTLPPALLPSHHNGVATTASLPVGNNGTYPMPSLYHHHHHHQQQQQHFVTYIIPHHHHYL
ncbi:cold-shock transcription factor [Mucor lusitanicus]|uniref:Cold-shock transcription factor n=2 Tax=Mucor circinelloides f. lusitanicus TaxID=29924 RepID=A0A168LCT3_MUCCL|nr:cold-shock transcription factor [Mucor lusitanicus]OAD03377.1 cold-shock transcription factor [Mucor lusitanicus CBS 277.49]